jgi:hypothetical protein
LDDGSCVAAIRGDGANSRVAGRRLKVIGIPFLKAGVSFFEFDQSSQQGRYGHCIPRA